MFLDGNYGFRLTDKRGVQLWSRDHVVVTPEQFEVWNLSLTYRAGDIVTASDGNYYQSLVTPNTNNDPVSSPSAWRQVRFLAISESEALHLSQIAGADSDEQAIIVGNGSAWSGVQLPALLQNYLGGLRISNDLTSGLLSVSAGGAANSTNQLMLYLTSAMTKDPLLPFEAGDGNGARATGAGVAGTDAIFLVKIGSTIDLMIDTDPNCANGVANNGVTQYRRIGWCHVLRSMIQIGDYFMTEPPPFDIGTTNPGTAAVLRTTRSAPLCHAMVVNGIGTNTNNDVALLITDPAKTDTAASDSNFTSKASANSTGTQQEIWSTVIERTNASRQIRTRLSFSDANTSIFGFIVGWIDSRSRNGR